MTNFENLILGSIRCMTDQDTGWGPCFDELEEALPEYSPAQIKGGIGSLVAKNQVIVERDGNTDLYQLNESPA